MLGVTSKLPVLLLSMRAMAVYAVLGGEEMVWSAMLVMSVSREKIWQMVVLMFSVVVVVGSGALSHSVHCVDKLKKILNKIEFTY